jgi:hypothetical protein
VPRNMLPKNSGFGSFDRKMVMKSIPAKPRMKDVAPADMQVDKTTKTDFFVSSPQVYQSS